MKAIIFDLDGTLIDSKEAHFKAFREVGIKLAKTALTIEQFKKWYFPNYLNIWKNLGIDERDWAKANEMWQQIVARENPGLVSNAREILEYFKSKGYKIALVTSGNEKRVSSDLEREKIKNFFNVIVCEDGFKKHEVKPAPNQLLVALEKLDEDASNAVYIGDTPTDVMTGKNAKMETIAITTGFGLLEKIKETKPDIVINSLEELKKIF